MAGRTTKGVNRPGDYVPLGLERALGSELPRFAGESPLHRGESAG